MNALRTVMLGALALAASESHPDEAPRLMGLKGSVLVNEGVAYRKGIDGMPLKAGDRIMTLRNGFATILYSDRCELTLEPSSIEQVGNEASCLAALAPEYDPSVMGMPRETVDGLTAGAISGGLIYLLKDSRDDQDQRPLSP